MKWFFGFIVLLLTLIPTGFYLLLWQLLDFKGFWQKLILAGFIGMQIIFLIIGGSIILGMLTNYRF